MFSSAPRMELIVAERFGVGESPVWDADNNRLLWCDIPAGRIHALSLSTGARQLWQFDSPVPSLGLAQNGRWVVALANDVILFDPETGDREIIATITHSKPDMRLNDGKIGPDGAFWVGSMDGTLAAPLGGKLYRVAPDGSFTTIATDLAISNGLAWNADATRLYHSDSRGGMWIDCWDFDAATGTVRNRRRLRDNDLVNGRPDGGACDLASHYWSAGPSESRINCFAPDGTLIGAIPVPLKNPTMPCFGGPDMKTLFVTSLDSKIETSGHDGILVIDLDVAGVPVHKFGR
jgi:sugar lactone lactonase YvrE